MHSTRTSIVPNYPESMKELVEYKYLGQREEYISASAHELPGDKTWVSCKGSVPAQEQGSGWHLAHSCAMTSDGVGGG